MSTQYSVELLKRADQRASSPTWSLFSWSACLKGTFLATWGNCAVASFVKIWPLQLVSLCTVFFLSWDLAEIPMSQ